MLHKPLRILLVLASFLTLCGQAFPSPAYAMSHEPAGCPYQLYSLPTQSYIQLQDTTSGQVVHLARHIVKGKYTAYIYINNVYKGEYYIPVNLGPVAVKMHLTNQLETWLGQVQQALKEKPQVLACNNWRATIVPFSTAEVAAQRTDETALPNGLSAPLLENEGGLMLPAGFEESGGAGQMLPGLGNTTALALSTQPANAINSASSVSVSLPSLPALPANAAQSEPYRARVVEELGVQRDETSVAQAASPNYSSLFEPYDFSNYYRSLTSYSNFSYLNLWRGWNLNQILGYTDRFISNILRNPYIWRSQAAVRSDADQLFAAAADQESIGLPVLNGMHGASGNWNQFEGSLPYPDFNGGATETSQTSLVEAAILGLTPSSARNFGSQFQADLSSLLTPWTVYTSWLDGEAQSASSDGTTPNAQSVPYDQRYRAIGEMQATVYSNAPALSDLRKESNRVSFGLLYLDPYYVYYTVELSNFWQQIFQGRPSYAQWVAVQEEIAAWQDVPTDDATLAYRANKRQELNQWYSQVYLESLAYLYQPQNSATLQSLLDINSYLQNLASNIWNSANYTEWSASWSSSWSATHEEVLAKSKVGPAMQKLLKDEPAFQEYLQLNQQVGDLLSTQLADHPAVQKVSEQAATVLLDTKVNSTVEEAYATYQEQVAALLDQTNYKAKVEALGSQVNADESNSEEYDKLILRYESLSAAFSTYQVNMHAAVAACFATDGAQCNAYNDAQVIALQSDPATLETVRGIGDFYEEARLYWQNFYSGKVYKAVEKEASTAMTSALKPVSTEINTMRGDFMSTIYNNPKVAGLQSASLTMLQTLRGKNAQSASADMADYAEATKTLDQKLARMSLLATQLEGRTPAKPEQPVQPIGKLYLPSLRH